MDRDLGKFKIGQEVWMKVEDCSYLVRHLDYSNIEEWIRKGQVVKVGRKYIHVEISNNSNHIEKFNKEDDYRSYYSWGCADYKLYLTKQDILDEIESEKLYQKIKCVFDAYKNNNKFTLDQLRKIKNIIDEGEDDNEI